MTDLGSSFDYCNQIESDSSEKCVYIKEEFSDSKCNRNDNHDVVQNTHKPYEITFLVSNMKNEKLSDESTYCQDCQEEYEAYCWRCNMLIRILDNNAGNTINKAWDSIPKDILEIIEVNNCIKGVFALKIIPKGVDFGPFEGIKPKIENNICTWKLIDGRFTNGETNDILNWMQFVNCTDQCKKANLIVYQQDGNLYFQAKEAVNIGEELLVFIDERCTTLDNKMGRYLTPDVQIGIKTTYACTFCCLGFSSDVHLWKHKLHCPFVLPSDLGAKEIIACTYCKICISKTEYSTYHFDYCQEKNQQKSNVPLADTPIQRRYACLRCKYNTNSLYKFNKHVYIHNKPFKCTICGKGFSSKFYKNRHVLNHRRRKSSKKNQIKLFQCDVCMKQFTRVQVLNKHSIIHTERELFGCHLCEFQCKMKENLNLHLRNKHFTGDKRFKCLKCDYETNYKTCLLSHSYTHGGVKPYECELCEKRFADKASLNKHRYTHVEEKAFGCPHCLRRYSTRKNLNKHIRDKHCGNTVKQFKCSKCPYETNYKSNLNSHLTTHEDAKPFECDVCSKRFKQRAHLKTHQTTHSDQKKFECDMCGMRFTRKEHLKRHLIVHSVEKPFQCVICEKTFARKETLKTHSQIHAVEKKFRCQLCDYQCNHKFSLNLHLKSKHNVEHIGDLGKQEME